ncbi:MAG: phospholipase [Myxococcales bacterium]|nr:phospholipase [Myxococcales bacterium]
MKIQHTPWYCRPRALVSLTLASSLLGTPAFANRDGDDFATATPVKHVVVIFQENVSFDHYFATYPRALNESGVPRFVARPDTPSVNGLRAGLVTHNPNAAPPLRLSRAQAVTCDQDHDYTAEQAAFDFGIMDKFVEFAGNADTGCDAKIVMGYYDGNTVTALWNYAQHFAMSDNSFNTTFGPSTPGALNLIAGQTHGATPTDIKDETVQGTIIGDPRPALDDCSPTTGALVTMHGRNVGDLLNEHAITWGWFQGGFRPTSHTATGQAVCGATHTGLPGTPKADYIPHHAPFQYYPQTANPHHLTPSSTAMIGRTDRANHQYDLADFWEAVDHDHLPAVSFLKAPGYQDGHAGYSSPLDEQSFLVETINRLQASREWDETAVIISYDDSDGWYDHVLPPIVSQSSTVADALTGPGACGVQQRGTYGGRCGYGPRLPLLVVSPFARTNFVDHAVTDQSSILRFIEDNWKLGRLGDQSFDADAGSLGNLFDFQGEHRAPRLLLDPATGLRRR